MIHNTNPNDSQEGDANELPPEEDTRNDALEDDPEQQAPTLDDSEEDTENDATSEDEPVPVPTTTSSTLSLSSWKPILGAAL